MCGLKPYFAQCENPLTALSVPLITVISFCCAVFLHFSLSTNGDTCKIHASGQQSPCTLCPAQHLAFDRKLLPFPLLLWDTRGSGGVCDPTPTPPLLPAWDFSALTRLFSQPNNGEKKNLFKCILNRFDFHSEGHAEKRPAPAELVLG